MAKVTAGSGSFLGHDHWIRIKVTVLFTFDRFSCCAKVFPCDKYAFIERDPCFRKTDIDYTRCHDADTDHPNEHANRMIW